MPTLGCATRCARVLCMFARIWHLRQGDAAFLERRVIELERDMERVKRRLDWSTNLTIPDPTR